MICNPDSTHRVTLTDAELQAHESMPFGDGLVSLWNLILSRCGEPSLAERTTSIRPGDYAIPQEQAARLLGAWMNSEPSHARAQVGMTFVNVGPSSFAAEA